MTCPANCSENLSKRDVHELFELRNAMHPVYEGKDSVRRAPRLRNPWDVVARRLGVEILTGDFQSPIRDAWNWLLFTEAVEIRRTSGSIVTTTLAATFTLDVFLGGSTSWPTLTATPPFATISKEPACIPATPIQPILTTIAKRDSLPAGVSSVKPYVTRESTTVVVKIRDNHLEMTSNLPTYTQTVKAASNIDGGGARPDAPVAMRTQTIAIESINAAGFRETQSVVVVRPNLTAGGDVPLETGASSSDDNNGGGGAGGAGDGGGSSGNAKIERLSGNQLVVDVPFTVGAYVAALYIPAVTAVSIKMLFETIVASIKMMEPFERLHRSQGATSEDSLCSQYLSSSLSWDTVRSIWSGRSIPLWTTIIYILITIGAPLSSSSMTVRPMDTCDIDGASHLCSPAWIVDLQFVRLMEALLVLCMTLTLVLAWDSWTYHAGVATNPTSIASVAVLLNYEPLRQDLQGIDPDATEEELRKALEEHHFWMTFHRPSRDQSRYGLIHAQASTTPTTESFSPCFGKVETRYNRLKPTSIRKVWNDAFNLFFASNTFWPKLILVSLATVLDMQWKNLEREVRIMEPYRRLFLGNARPENTILRSLNGTCWTNGLRCLRDLFQYPNMWFESVVGLTAILSDINIIAVSGVLMTYSQTKAAYEWSSFMALSVTMFMTVVLLRAMLWRRRTEAISTMPRIPETVGAVLSYLCISRMAIDFASMNMENLSKEDRDEIIISKGQRYRFGRMFGEDGKQRFCVDYEDFDADDGQLERDSWLQAKMERPVPVRLST